MFKWMFTRKASYTCVDPGTASAKTNRDSFGGDASTRSEATPRPKMALSGKQRLLTVTTSHMYSISISTSKLFVLELDSDKWQPAGQFQGYVVAMDYSENVLYLCQKNPGGLFTTHVQVGRNQEKPEKIIDGACTSVAVDPVVVRAFFINSSGLWSYNLVSKIITKLPVALRGRANRIRVIVETREHVVYVYGRYKRDIRKYDHSGKFLTSFSIEYPVRDVVIYSGQSHSSLYCTYTVSPSVVNRYSLPGWARTTDFKLTDTHRWKLISSLAVTDNKIFLTYGRFLRVLDSKTLRENSTLVFETFGESFRNLLVIEGQNVIH
ncbi:uncharacterized protein LOC124127249 [Haliotis rufescens]|uniref:uncharacterized protein LOC124127249 n=1 Tax=Haliotis rufescens TaxID=6454 RepID=UPI00201F0CF9|nr:uncharacterized protein LOC124127249 [Haliotis rufescens]